MALITNTIIASGADASIMKGLSTPGKESPPRGERGPLTGGSGPYPAEYHFDETLPNHTVYAPKTPPPITMPVIVFGNGGCTNIGSMITGFLEEISSHGYLVRANSNPKASVDSMIPEGVDLQSNIGALLQSMAGMLGQGSKVKQQKEAIEWVRQNRAQNYVDIDTEKIAAAGQSCGGLEAYSTSYHDPRIKLTALFNVGVFVESSRYLMSELKAPLGWFVGGPNDAS
jgi:dienelactone hydrolase